MRALVLLPLLGLAACGRGVGIAPVPGGEQGADAGVEVDAGPPPHGPPYPVVFVHGMAGFDALKVAGLSMDYWGNTVEDLAARGEDVYRVVLPPFDDDQARVKALEAQLLDILAQSHSAKVNLIAHSQGGLDARLLVSPAGLGWGDRVGTLVTVSTPHRGTQAANVLDGAASGLPDSVVDGLASLLQRSVYDVQSDPHLKAQLHAITEDATKTFNATYVDDARVRYLSWAGRSNLHTGLGVCDDGVVANEWWKVDVLLPVFSGIVIATEWGLPPQVSDGLVTVASAKWGTFQGCVPADHLDEVGMPNVNGADLTLFDSKQFYRDIVSELRAHGD
jgi:triacylglycerol lipase